MLSTRMTPNFLPLCVGCGLASPSLSLNESGLCCLKSVSCFGRLKDFATFSPCVVGGFSLALEPVEGNEDGKCEVKPAAGLTLSWDMEVKMEIGFVGVGVVAVDVARKDSLGKPVSIFMMP